MDRMIKIMEMLIKDNDPSPRLNTLNDLILDISAQFGHRVLIVTKDWKLMTDADAEERIVPHCSTSILKMPTGSRGEKLTTQRLIYQHRDKVLLYSLFERGFNLFLTEQQRHVYAVTYFGEILEAQHIDTSLGSMSGAHRKFYAETAAEAFLECVDLDIFGEDGIMLDYVPRLALAEDRIAKVDPKHKFQYFVEHPEWLAIAYPVVKNYIDPENLKLERLVNMNE